MRSSGSNCSMCVYGRQRAKLFIQILSKKGAVGRYWHQVAKEAGM